MIRDRELSMEEVLAQTIMEQANEHETPMTAEDAAILANQSINGEPVKDMQVRRSFLPYQPAEADSSVAVQTTSFGGKIRDVLGRVVGRRSHTSGNAEIQKPAKPRT